MSSVSMQPTQMHPYHNKLHSTRSSAVDFSDSLDYGQKERADGAYSPALKFNSRRVAINESRSELEHTSYSLPIITIQAATNERLEFGDCARSRRLVTVHKRAVPLERSPNRTAHTRRGVPGGELMAVARISMRKNPSAQVAPARLRAVSQKLMVAGCGGRFFSPSRLVHRIWSEGQISSLSRTLCRFPRELLGESKTGCGAWRA
jgi:hypothetical protein